MCVGKPKQIDSAGAPQQMTGQTPFQAFLGKGHLSGMAPEGRTGAMMLAAEGLRGATKMVPIVGPVFNVGKDVQDADYEGAGTAAFAGLRNVSPAMMRMITAMDSADQGDK